MQLWKRILLTIHGKVWVGLGGKCVFPSRRKGLSKVLPEKETHELLFKCRDKQNSITRENYKRKHLIWGSWFRRVRVDGHGGEHA